MTAEAAHVQTVARLEMTVAAAEPTSEADERWTQRAEALARWLEAEWRREHAEVEG